VVGFHLQLTQGPLQLAFDDEVLNLDGEWFWPTEPGPRVRFKPVGASAWFHRHVGFMGTRVLEWRKAALWPPKPSPTPGGNNWAEAFDELYELSRHTDGWSRHRATNLVERVLMEAADAAAVRPPPRPWLDEVVKRLEDEGFSPDYAGIASEMGLSESALRRRFKRESGELAIHEYVVLNRLGKAKTLLESTDMTVAEIAEACGYGTESSFARQFRTHASIPPGQYRRFARS
jgi:AraC-like DNA-binding protein